MLPLSQQRLHSSQHICRYLLWSQPQPRMPPSPSTLPKPQIIPPFLIITQSSLPCRRQSLLHFPVPCQPLMQPPFLHPWSPLPRCCWPRLKRR